MPKKFLRTLQIGFGISIIILLASSIASYLSINEQLKNRRKVEYTREVISAVNSLLIDLQNAETGQRGFYLTGKESFLEPYLASQQSMPASISHIKELTKNSVIQSARTDTLVRLIQQKEAITPRVISIRRQENRVPAEDLEQSKFYMDSCRDLIGRMIFDEEQALNRRTEVLDRSSTYTTNFILLASFLSLLIATIFYRRIREDFAAREALQHTLRLKDAEMSRRVNIIQKITDQIAHGDYTVRINDAQKDDLGSLAISINEMTDSLQLSFDKLNTNEWRQTGLAALNEILVGNKTEAATATDALQHIITYTESTNGALYLAEGNELRLRGHYGLEEHVAPVVPIGKGAIGQVFKNANEQLFEHLDHSEYVVSFASGIVRITNIAILPIMVEKQCIGVLEVASIAVFSEASLNFFREACQNIGLALVAAHGRAQVQRLLEETQAQSEELQMQHAELENLNTELEAQAQKLQASEEELKVQQEELLQSNTELEERSKVLEEKNQLIAERNQEIKTKAEELALSTKYKSEFLANMSHELRTPLNSILLLSRLLAENAEKNLHDEQVESAQVIQSSGTSLLSLIDEILDLSKIEAGKMELDYQEVDLHEVVTDLRNLFAPMSKEKSLELTLSIQEGLHTRIQTDRLRLDQVLRNFLSNALKFTAEGTISLRITASDTKKDYLVFAVSDTGVGIPESKQKVIFEAFQQADGSTRRKFGGTGLGLSISREIARLLGGEIQLDSKDGVGSTFSLIIPNGKPLSIAPPPVVELIETISLSEEEAIVDPIPVARHTVLNVPDEIADDRHEIVAGDKVILIVEDDTNFAKALLAYARQQQYKGIVIVRGDMAAPFAEQYQPLAILLDIQLPIKDGWQVMDEIKNNPATRHIPVHIMSSLEVKKQSLLKGAIDFINKPVALEQINSMFQKIEHALSRHPKKVLIVEENPKHATALSYFLSNFDISTEIKNNVSDSVEALKSEQADCVILDMGVPDKIGYETLEAIKANEGLENLPIIIFTGKNLSKAEEVKIRQYADSIVIKTAHSYQRILDEVGLFLHLVEKKKNTPAQRASSKMGSLSEVLKGKKVLIADDDIRNIFSLSKALEKFQMEVVSAIDGREALKQLEAHPDVSIVLMDMMMPEMDGYETIRLIRQDPKFHVLPIIAVTAKAMTGDRDKCIVAGASDYISKPVDIDQLLSLLRVWLYQS